MNKPQAFQPNPPRPGENLRADSKPSLHTTGASLIADKNITKNIIVKNNETQRIWGDHPDTDSFATLLNILRHKNDGTKLQHIVMRSRRATQTLLQRSLSEFLADPESDRKYETEYRQKKSHLGLTKEQLGFNISAAMQQCPDLDLIWNRLIEIVSNELSTNKMASFKALRRYVQQENVFRNLYETQIVGNILKPKTDEINKFFKPGTKELNEEQKEFFDILKKIISNFYQQLNSCIHSLIEIFEEDVYDGFQELFEPKSKGFGMLSLLWDAYCKLSQQILTPNHSKIISSKSQFYAEAKKILFRHKTTALANVIKLFYSFSTNFLEKETILAIPNEDNFLGKVVKKLDQDIIGYEKSDNKDGRIDQFPRFTVDLFLTLFPFKEFLHHNSNKFQLITKEIKSEQLQLVRLLFSPTSESETSKAVKQFEEIAKSSSWNAFSSKWKKWLGVFLKKYKLYLTKNARQLTKKILILCKSVAADEHQKFWSKDENNEPQYLIQIKAFLKQSVDKEFQCTTLNDVSLLPIFTKLLGKIYSKHTRNVIQNLMPENIVANIFNSITEALKIDAAKYQRQRYERINYYSQDQRHNMDQILEQEIKFICRLIEIETDNLQQVEKLLLDNAQIQDGTGTILIIKLLQIFYSISPDTVSGLKCLRYLIKAINSIFICVRTRTSLCIALAALDSGKSNYPKALRSIASCCYDYDSTSQIGRQTEKLRKEISFHLNCIVKISDSLEEYFPTTTRREANQEYRRLHEHLAEDRIMEANDYINELREKCIFGFKSVQWFYEFAKLLQSTRLTYIDLDTIRLLLLKMRIKREDVKEFLNLEVIVDILNQSKLEDIIIQALTPIVKRDQKQGREIYFLGLANRDHEGSMKKATRQFLNAAKYSNKISRKRKENALDREEKNEQYMKLSGCLSIIEVMLRLALEGDFPLLKRLKSNKFILDSFFSEKPYMYNIKFTYSYQKANDERTGIAILTGDWGEKQISSSVNLMHCIASYWDYQNRLKINDDEHPSYSLKLLGHFSLDYHEERYENSDLLYFSQENVLTDINRKPESLGISTISKIIEYIVLLGGGKTFYYSVLSRNYPISRGFITSTANLSMMEEFMEGITFAAKRRSATIQQRQHALELLSVLIKEKHFGEYIRNNIYRFKEALVRGRQFGEEKSFTTRLVMQMLHFLNLLLNIDPSSANIKFAKTCLSDPVQFGTKLISHCQNIGKITQILENAKKSKYGTFAWILTVREATISKLSLLLFLGVSSFFVSHQHQSLALSMANLILKNSSTFLKTTHLSVAEQSSKFFEKLSLRESLKVPGFFTSSNSKYFIVNDVFFNAILLHSPFSFIDNYLEQPWEVLQNTTPRQGKEIVLATHRYNSINAFHYANEALIQFYYLLVNSIFKRGQQGFYFITEIQKVINGKIPSIVMFKKQKARNGITSRSLVGQGEGFLSCCFRVNKDIEKQLWEDSKLQVRPPRDIGLITIGQIISSVEGKIEGQPFKIGECKKTVDKLLSYLKNTDNRFHTAVFITLVQALQKISQRLFAASLASRQTPSSVSQAYFKRIQQCIALIEGNICFDSLGKLHKEELSILILQFLNLFELEISNVQLIEKSDLDIIKYLQHESRFILLEKFKKIMASLMIFLSPSQYSPNIVSYILQLLSKAFTLDYISKRSRVSGIVRPVAKDLFSRLQKLCEIVVNQDEINSIYLLRFIMEAVAFSENQQNKHMIKIFKTGIQKVTESFDKITEMKSLREVIRNSSILGAFSSLSLEENWKCDQFQTVLDKLFILIQERPLQFSPQKITAGTKIENQLSNTFLKDLRRSKPMSIFSLYAQFCTYQFLNNYLLFLSFAIKYSPNLHELCSNTFNKGPLEDLSLDRIRESLLNAIQFMTKFSSLCFNHQIEDLLKINSFACVDDEFIREMNLLSLCFQNYSSKPDFYSNIFDTLSLLYEAVTLLCQTWIKYDWKSIADWGPSRKDLLLQLQKLITLYKGFFKDYREVNYEKTLGNIGEYIRNDLEGYKV